MKRIAWILIAIAIVIALACTYRFSFPLLFHLLLGWIIFAWQTLPTVSLRIDGLASFAVALVMLIGVAHWFLRWLTANMAPSSESPPRQWRLRWTLCGTAIVLLFFVAGIALVGITHQAAWLATAPEAVVVRRISHGDTYLRHSQFNLKYIGLGVHNHFDSYRSFTGEVNARRVAAGRAPQSWIHQIMPFMPRMVTERYDDTKPWDSPQNRAEFQRVFPDFLNPDLPTAAARNAECYGISHYAGNELIFGPEHAIEIDDSSNTLMIGELDADFSPWGEPGVNLRPPVMRSATHPGFGGPPQHRTVMFVMVDGRVREIDKDIDPEVLRALGSPRKQ